MRPPVGLAIVLAVVARVAAAQQPPASQPLPRIPPPRPMPAYPAMPAPAGYRVFISTDMEGLGSVVFNREIIAGNETERYRQPGSSSPDYWAHYRDLLTREVNAVIGGARLAGARSFVVNEGHGGNLFGNILPWDLDSAALLVRGWPKPLVMTTGLDSSASAAIFVGYHAGPHTPGVIAHAYAFDSIIVDGHWLNETGVNALVAGEYGVPTVMVSGDNVAMAQARDQLGPSVVTVVTKLAIGTNAAVTWSPAAVRRMLRDSARVAIARARRGEIQPFRLDKPYQVDLVLRRSFPQNIADAVDSLATTYPGFRRTGERTYHFTTGDARDLARLFDLIEEIALR